MKTQPLLPTKFAIVAIAIAATAVALTACGEKQDSTPSTPPSTPNTNAPANPDDAMHPRGRGGNAQP
jgi:predicted lipoprotein